MSFKSGLLWKLQLDESNTSYLFGTIHLNSFVFAKNQQLFSDLIKACNIFAAEVDLDYMQSSDMSQYFMIPENVNWSSLLKANQWNRIKQICNNRFKLSIDQFINVYPLVLVNQLSLQLIGMHVEKSLDQYLWDLAAEQKKQRLGLEDFDFHFSMLSKIEITDQLKMLKDLLKNLPHSRRKYLNMLRDYHAEDLQKIYSTSKKMLGKYRKLMLYERNQIMFQNIMKICRNDNCFFTCGAGHLYGEKGILRLLKKEGVKLKHVSI